MYIQVPAFLVHFSRWRLFKCTFPLDGLIFACSWADAGIQVPLKCSSPAVWVVHFSLDQPSTPNTIARCLSNSDTSYNRNRESGHSWTTDHSYYTVWLTCIHFSPLSTTLCALMLVFLYYSIKHKQRSDPLLSIKYLFINYIVSMCDLIQCMSTKLWICWRESKLFFLDSIHINRNSSCGTFSNLLQGECKQQQQDGEIVHSLTSNKHCPPALTASEHWASVMSVSLPLTPCFARVMFSVLTEQCDPGCCGGDRPL